MKYGFDNVKFRVIYFVYKSVKKGFTLLELLLVIAIIAALASLIFFTLSPADRLNDANAAKTLASAKDLEKAIKTYVVSNAGNLPSSLQNISQPGIYDICKTGQTIGCINLDELIAAGTLSSIPEDANNSTQYLTGYKLKYSPTANFFNVYLQNDYDNELVFCPPGDFNCTSPYTQWLLNENAGSNMGDSLGTYSSTITGATWAEGYEGSGLFFDGVDDYASSSGVFTKLGTSNTPYTISGWIKVAPGETNGNIVHMANGSGGSGWCLPPMAMNSKRLKATSWNGGQISITDSFTMLEDVWYHFATTWDSTNGLRLYRNGSLVANTAQAIYSASGSANYIFLGFSPGGCAGNEGMFNGTLDKIRFFDYSRTPAQIAWEYNQGLPFAYWKLDEASGSTAADISGNGATGTLVNGGTWVSGKYGNAISLDGSNDYVDFGNSLPNLSGWKQLSITGWFRSTSISGERTIISKFWEGDQGYGSSVYKIWTSGSELRFKLSTNGSWDGLYVRATGITTSQWNHFAAIWDGAYYKIYLNGILAEQKSRGGVLTNPGHKTTIGSVSDGTSSYFGGLVDDIRIYSYALNQTQIMESMHVR